MHAREGLAVKAAQAEQEQAEISPRFPNTRQVVGLHVLVDRIDDAGGLALYLGDSFCGSVSSAIARE